MFYSLLLSVLLLSSNLCILSIPVIYTVVDELEYHATLKLIQSIRLFGEHLSYCKIVAIIRGDHAPQLIQFADYFRKWNAEYLYVGQVQFESKFEAFLRIATSNTHEIDNEVIYISPENLIVRNLFETINENSVICAPSPFIYNDILHNLNSNVNFFRITSDELFLMEKCGISFVYLKTRLLSMIYSKIMSLKSNYLLFKHTVIKESCLYGVTEFMFNFALYELHVTFSVLPFKSYKTVWDENIDGISPIESYHSYSVIQTGKSPPFCEILPLRKDLLKSSAENIGYYVNFFIDPHSQVCQVFSNYVDASVTFSLRGVVSLVPK